MAALIKNQSRKMDFVCRYGGEEFALILPQADKKEAFLIAERLRMDIEKFKFTQEEIRPTGKLTCSLGIATYPENASTPAELIAAARWAVHHLADEVEQLRARLDALEAADGAD
jgi:diguanylate cyclase (GGDEF)-like protein